MTSISLNSCFIVKESTENDIAPSVKLSPKPQIAMSETLVRSDKGDMIALLPKKWFFVDLEDKESPNVFSVAVNPDYTLSAIFSLVRKNEKVENLVRKEGLIGLARYCLSLKQQKSGDAVKLAGKYRIINMGPLSFCKYSYMTAGRTLTAQSAVFISSLGRYYEFTLIPMNIKEAQMPPIKEIEETFNSIVTTIQY